MKKRRLKTISILFAIILSGYFVGVSMEADHIGAHSESVAKGADLKSEELTVAPEFMLPDLSGADIKLSDYQGRWVFMNFWATWCGPCIIEMPMMNRLNNLLKGDKFKMLAINMEDIEPEKAKNFVKKLKVDFTVLLDRNSEVAKLYGVSLLPMTYMINPKGEVEAIAEGMREWDDPKMVQYFRDLMDGKLDHDGKVKVTSGK
jgi:peroxiredoxin